MNSFFNNCSNKIQKNIQKNSFQLNIRWNCKKMLEDVVKNHRTVCLLK